MTAFRYFIRPHTSRETSKLIYMHHINKPLSISQDSTLVTFKVEPWGN